MAKKEQKKLTNSERAIGLAMDALAGEMAVSVATLAMPTIDRLNAARQEWEGGAFSVMFKVTSGMTAEQLDSLPDPRATSGNNPGEYFTVVVSDGKEKVREHNFYEEMTLNFPGIRSRGLRIDQLKRSMADASKVNTSDIGQDIKDMSIDYRNAEIARLTKEISGAVTKIQNAFGLYHQFRAFDTLKHVECYPICKLGPDNLPLDGTDGRDYMIEPTQTPIVVRSTVKGREGIDTVRVSISTFLRYNVEAAKENGGTYQSVIDTVKREKKSDDKTGNAGAQAVPQLIRTSDTFLARATDQYEFADHAWSQKDDKLIDGIRKALTGAGSDNNFTACMGLKKFLNEVCPDSPRNVQRYQELINAEQEQAA